MKKRQQIILFARSDCRYCGGRGYVIERHPYGSTTAIEYLDCECPYIELTQEAIEAVESGSVEVVIKSAAERNANA